MRSMENPYALSPLSETSRIVSVSPWMEIVLPASSVPVYCAPFT